MSAPISTQFPSSPAPFFIITRHTKTAQLLQKLGGRVVNNVNEIPQGSLVIGVLPLDLISMLTNQGSKFISVAVDVKKFEDRFNTPYNPKTAESFLEKLSDEEFIGLLTFTLYEKVDVVPVSTDEVLNECRDADIVYYNGSKSFADGLMKLCNKPVVTDISNVTASKVVPFSPIDGNGYYVKVVDRNLIINTGDEFIDAVSRGMIKFYKASSVMRRLTLQDVLALINAQGNTIQENMTPRTVTREL